MGGLVASKLSVVEFRSGGISGLGHLALGLPAVARTFSSFRVLASLVDASAVKAFNPQSNQSVEMLPAFSRNAARVLCRTLTFQLGCPLSALPDSYG